MWSWEKAWRLKHKATIFALLLKGRMSRICQLRFVNTTFKVGPSSPAPASSWMRAYDLAPGRNIFIVVPPSHPARCYWLGTTQPLPKSWRPETSQTQHNKKIRAEGRFSADTVTTHIQIHVWKQMHVHLAGFCLASEGGVKGGYCLIKMGHVWLQHTNKVGSLLLDI